MIEYVTPTSLTSESVQQSDIIDECLWKTISYQKSQNEYIDDIDEISPEVVSMP